LASSGEVSIFTLSLKDSSGSVAIKYATVAVTVTPVDDAPTDLNFTPASFTGSVTSGRLIGTFSPVDPDGSSDSYTYALVSGDGDDDNADFTLGTGTRANQLVAGTKLNAGTYHILAQVTDSKGHSFHKAFTISIS
jgi:hypothetical protein